MMWYCGSQPLGIFSVVVGWNDCIVNVLVNVSHDVSHFYNISCNHLSFVQHLIGSVVLSMSSGSARKQGRGSHGAKAAVAHTKFRPMAPR